MNTFTEYLWFETKARRELVNITERLDSIVRKSGISDGMCLVSARCISRRLSG